MNVVTVTIIGCVACVLPIGLRRAYDSLENQNERQVNDFAIVIVLRLCLDAMSTYLPYSAEVCLGFLLASVCDSLWIAIPLFAALAPPCAVVTQIASVFVLTLFIEIARKWIEDLGLLEPRFARSFFRTNYTIENVFANTAFKVVMLPPALFLIWFLPCTMGYSIFCAGSVSLGILDILISLTLLGSITTYCLIRDLYNHLLSCFTPVHMFFTEVDATDSTVVGEVCPISQFPMRHPVRTRCGHTYERNELIKLIRGNYPRKCPTCRAEILPTT